MMERSPLHAVPVNRTSLAVAGFSPTKKATRKNNRRVSPTEKLKSRTNNADWLSPKESFPDP